MTLYYKVGTRFTVSHKKIYNFNPLYIVQSGVSFGGWQGTNFFKLFEVFNSSSDNF